MTRLLSRIYRLEEDSRVAELPREDWGHTYSVMTTIFFGGSFYPSNTINRTLMKILHPFKYPGLGVMSSK